MKEDIYIPYTKKPCSITNSWVKVTKKDNDYNYIVYLECGAIKSTVYHKGPQITLKGKMEETMTIEKDKEINMNIAYSSKYMLEALRTLKCETVDIRLNSEIKPIIVKNSEDDNLIQLVLPIKTF